jgi:hypothetical protein
MAMLGTDLSSRVRLVHLAHAHPWKCSMALRHHREYLSRQRRSALIELRRIRLA